MEQKYTYRHKIEWRIKNFSQETLAKYNKANPVKSEIIQTEDELDCHCELYPEDDDLKFRIVDKYLCSYDRRHSDGFSLKVVADYRHNRKSVKVEEKGGLDYYPNQCITLLKIKDIPKDLSSYLYLREYHKTLRLHIGFEHSNFGKKETFDEEEYEANAVAEEIGELFNKSIFSDVKIICSDGTEFPAHRFILAIRTPLFDVMLTAEMAERKTSTITINDIDGETMKHILLFLYKGPRGTSSNYQINQHSSLMDLDYNLASKLIHAAEKYDLPTLSEICAVNLNNKIVMENAIATLLLAEKFRQTKLKDVCLHFIAANFTELKETDEWKLLDHTMMTEIMKAMEELNEETIALVNTL